MTPAAEKAIEAAAREIAVNIPYAAESEDEMTERFIGSIRRHLAEHLGGQSKHKFAECHCSGPLDAHVNHCDICGKPEEAHQ